MVCGFHDGAVAAFKTLSSAKYDAKERIWSFDLSEHGQLMRKVAALRPDFVLTGLPDWVVRSFGGRKVAKTRGDDDDLWDNVEPMLREGLMPFQREGVEFAYKRNVSNELLKLVVQPALKLLFTFRVES